MVIRREAASDRDAVHALTAAAFGGRSGAQEPVESKLLGALRSDPGWIPSLSLVATVGEEIVGHVVCTRGWIGDLAALALGPIAVVPSQQRQGVGSALMHAVIGSADALGESLIALLGDESFYTRFGFVAAGQLGIAAPDPSWGTHFQVRTLTECPEHVNGTFRYAAPFQDL